MLTKRNYAVCISYVMVGLLYYYYDGGGERHLYVIKKLQSKYPDGIQHLHKERTISLFPGLKLMLIE